MIGVEVKDEGFTQRLIITIDRLQNMRPAMQEIGQYMEKSVRRTIDEGGRPTKWKANVWGSRIMYKSGATYNSIATEEVTDSSVTVVSRGGGNYHHNEARWIPSPKQKRWFFWKLRQAGLYDRVLARGGGVWFRPQRRFMMFQEQDKTEITNIIQTYLTKGE